MHHCITIFIYDCIILSKLTTSNLLAQNSFDKVSMTSSSQAILNLSIPFSHYLTVAQTRAELTLPDNWMDLNTLNIQKQCKNKQIDTHTAYCIYTVYCIYIYIYTVYSVCVYLFIFDLFLNTNTESISLVRGAS